MKKWFAVFSFLFSYQVVAADSTPYVGFNYVQASYKESGVETVKPTALAVRVGTELTRTLQSKAVSASDCQRTT